MSKNESQSSKFSSSLNIQTFGLETLLHKKIESERKFSEKLDNEKSELLHLMYTQKKLFDVDELLITYFLQFIIFFRILLFSSCCRPNPTSPLG